MSRRGCARAAECISGRPTRIPRLRIKMIEEAGELRIPFTTGILLGIGETPAERAQSLMAIRDIA